MLELAKALHGELVRKCATSAVEKAIKQTLPGGW